MSIFSAADAQASAAISRVFGDMVRLVPWRKGGEYTKAGGPDPSRLPPPDFQATIMGEASSQMLAGDRRGTAFEGGSIRTRDRVMFVDLPSWPDGVRQGDRVVALAEAGQPTYEILTFESDGASMVVQMVAS